MDWSSGLSNSQMSTRREVFSEGGQKGAASKVGRTPGKCCDRRGKWMKDFKARGVNYVKDSWEMEKEGNWELGTEMRRSLMA